MDAETARQLVALNRRFYTDFGAPFSATRGRIQPGIQRILDQLQGTERILDLGCGNGQLARSLAARGHAGTYLGLDFSPPLLESASAQPAGFSAAFRQVDLTSPDWEADPHGTFSLLPSSYDLIFSFAVLHHIPGQDLRCAILKKTHALLVPAGKFIHSEWQFLNSKKMKARIQPWEAAQLSTAKMDVGDTLLDWRNGGAGLRYVHHFSEPELAWLAAETGFHGIETFLSDGHGGRLSLYQTWEAIENG